MPGCLPIRPRLFLLSTPRLAADGGTGGPPLYQPYSPQFSPCELTFIPYYTFANRGESDMRVWIPVAETPGKS